VVFSERRAGVLAYDPSFDVTALLVERLDKR
jgi:hypothetical protein